MFVTLLLRSKALFVVSRAGLRPSLRTDSQTQVSLGRQITNPAPPSWKVIPPRCPFIKFLALSLARTNKERPQLDNDLEARDQQPAILANGTHQHTDTRWRALQTQHRRIARRGQMPRVPRVSWAEPFRQRGQMRSMPLREQEGSANTPSATQASSRTRTAARLQYHRPRAMRQPTPCSRTTP